MDKKIRILLPDVIMPPAEVEKEVFEKDAEIIIGQSTDAVSIADDIWHSCDAILAYDKLEYDKKLLSKLKNCKVIVRVGVGYDNVDLAEAKKRGIAVCNVPDYGTEEVADHTMALLLSLVRNIPEYSKEVKQRTWVRSKAVPFRLNGKVMGIIGLGRIGTAVALRAKAFNMKIVFYDPYIKDGYDKALGVEKVDSLNELAEKADIISIHTPLTDETNKMIANEFFNALKNKIILLNTARGAVVDLIALEKAMKSGSVIVAGLDVLPIEPSNDSQQLIVDYENDAEWLKGRLVVTPHIAFYSPEAYIEMRKKAALEAKRIINGEKPRNCVNGC